MGGLHRAGTTSGGHQLAFFGEILADQRYFSILRICAPEGVAAHDGYDLSGAEAAEIIGERVFYGAVVEGSAERFADFVALFALSGIVVVDLGVAAGCEGLRLIRVEAFVKLFGGVEAPPECAVGEAQAGKLEIRGVQQFLHLMMDGAPEKEAVTPFMPGSNILRNFVEINVLEYIVGYTPLPVRPGKTVDGIDFLVRNAGHKRMSVFWTNIA